MASGRGTCRVFDLSTDIRPSPAQQTHSWPDIANDSCSSAV